MSADTCATSARVRPKHLDAAAAAAESMHQRATNRLLGTLAEAAESAITDTAHVVTHFVLPEPVAFVHTDGTLMATSAVVVEREFARLTPARQFEDEDMIEDRYLSTVTVIAQRIDANGNPVYGHVRIEAPAELADAFDPDNAALDLGESDEEPAAEAQDLTTQAEGVTINGATFTGVGDGIMAGIAEALGAQHECGDPRCAVGIIRGIKLVRLS